MKKLEMQKVKSTPVEGAVSPESSTTIFRKTWKTSNPTLVCFDLNHKKIHITCEITATVLTPTPIGTATFAPPPLSLPVSTKRPESSSLGRSEEKLPHKKDTMDYKLKYHIERNISRVDPDILERKNL